MKHWHQQKNDLSDRSVCVFLARGNGEKTHEFLFGRVFTQPPAIAVLQVRCMTDGHLLHRSHQYLGKTDRFSLVRIFPLSFWIFNSKHRLLYDLSILSVDALNLLATSHSTDTKAFQGIQ